MASSDGCHQFRWFPKTGECRLQDDDGGVKKDKSPPGDFCSFVEGIWVLVNLIAEDWFNMIVLVTWFQNGLISLDCSVLGVLLSPVHLLWNSL